jgi:putative ABC transport system permease protein
MSILVQLLLFLVLAVFGVFALTAVLMLLLGVVLTFVFLLQLLGVLRRIPFAYNLRNLVVRWPTTLLTALAFTMVVALLTVMLAFVNGLFRLTQASGQSVNVLVLSDGATEESISSLGYGDITTLNQYPAIVKDENGEPLISWEVYLVVNQPIENAKPGGQQRRFLQVRGLMDPARTGRVHNIALHPGGAWFTQTGVQPLPGGSSTGEQAIQVVLGEGIARVLGADQGKPSLQVGDVFGMAERKWVVVGLLQSAGSTFDSEIWAKQQIVGEKFGKPSYSTVVMRTADAETARRTAEDLSADFKPAVAAQLETAYYEKLNSTNLQFFYAALVIAGFMALGGIFGIMNTMFAAISQRQKDIGVLRILGYARWQILESFFLESLMLALLGGGIGCLLGSLVDGWSASSIISSSQGGGRSVVFQLVVDGKILLCGLVFSLLMGNIGGLLPALSSMRVRPLESVR